ncbi:MAG: DUF1854 domain-containing protein, partial [Planctomycetota bacterium]|nr:DUF1854 domain-containing protein [Planctomycetota bacterium]
LTPLVEVAGGGVVSIAESGSHDELMKLDGKYAKLVKIQGSAAPTDSIEALQAKEALAKDEAALAAIPMEQRQDPKTGLTPITGHRPRWLEPRFAHIHLGNRNALHVTIENERIYNGVFALRCMPVRFPNQFISLRWFNAENRDQEIGLIRDLSEWPVEVQQLVNESLLRRYFIHNILEIESITNEHNYLTFVAKTDLGPRTFVVRWAYETAHDYGPKGKVLVDTEENRYVVPDVNLLPEASRKKFERFIYW